MGDAGPLAGRTVVVCRPVEGAPALAELLEQAGARTVVVPLIEIVDVASPSSVAAAVGGLVSGDWVVVASAHAAARVASHVPSAVARGVHVAAVGATTAAALAHVDLVAPRQSAEGLVAIFPRASGAPASAAGRVLVAQAEGGAPTLVEGLTALGWRVDRLDTHVSRPLRLGAREQLAVLQADVVAFTSGSQAAAWVATLGTATPPLVVAIGPQTARDAQQAGLKVDEIAADHSLSGLLDAILRAYGVA